MKVFRLFRLEWIFLGVQSVNTVDRCTTSLSIGRASVFMMPSFFFSKLSSLTCSQIWLSLLAYDGNTTKLTKLEKKKTLVEEQSMESFEEYSIQPLWLV